MMFEQFENRDQQQSMPRRDGNEVHMLDLLIILARHKKLVIGMPIGVGLIAMVISLLMTPIFTSTAKIVPQQQQSSGLAAAMLGQLGGLASAAGSIAGLKNPNELYVGILESRTVADALIKRFKLKSRYEAETMDEARKSLNDVTDIEDGKKDGLISISVNDKDPQFAANLANAYTEELINLMQTMTISDASMRRAFFEKQVKEAKDQLADAEVELQKTQEKTGMIQPDGQVEAIISSIAKIKAMIVAKEVQIKTMRTFATVQNPELMRAQEELQGLQTQLAKLEKSQPNKKGDFMVPAGLLPEVGVEYVRRLREVKYYETLFEMLAKQYELAKVEESRNSPIIQVLDKAVPAERKTKPKRAFITILGLALGGIFGVLLAYMREAHIRSLHNPENSVRWKELSAAISKRRCNES